MLCYGRRHHACQGRNESLTGDRMTQSICYLIIGSALLRAVLNVWFDSESTAWYRAVIESWRDGSSSTRLGRLIRWAIGGAVTCRFCIGYHICFLAATAATLTAPERWSEWWLLAFAVRGLELLVDELSRKDQT